MNTLWPVTPFGASSPYPPGYLPQPQFAGAGGVNTEGDALVVNTMDGVPINDLWNQIQAILAEWNKHRSALVNLLSYSTTNIADAVPQGIFGDESFELASEFGEPESIKAPTKHLLLGYTLEDYDKATRFTWKALRAMTSEQVQASANYALEADNRLTNGLVMQRLFSNTPETNEWNHTVYPLWSADSTVPPPFNGKTFDGNHNHYLVSGAATIDSGDLDAAIDNVQEHGYGLPDDGSQLIAFVNPQEAREISKFKAGVLNNNDAIANHDYIPSASAPAYILPQAEIVGTVAPGEQWGLRIQGSYGPLWISESYYVPAGYVAVVCTRGPSSPTNPIGLRQHINPAYQGLRQIPGNDSRYPLTESFFARAIGVGTRHRGAAVITQIKATGSYQSPAIAL